MYLQDDKRWETTKLGTSQDTIGQSGCLLTCFTMIAENCGHPEIPPTLNRKFIDRGLYLNQCLLGAGTISTLYPDIVYGGDFAFNNDQVKEWLTNYNIIFKLDYDSNPNDGFQTHFVLLDRVDTEIYLHDPIWGDCKLTDHYALSAILRVYLYKRIQPPTPAPITPPAATEPPLTKESLADAFLALAKKYNSK